VKRHPDINDTLRDEGTEAVRARHDRAHRKANGKARYTIEDIHRLFQKWFGKEYDMETADAVLAVVAAEKLPGDPPWLMIISGPGNAKSETVNSVCGVEHAVAVSTISSEGALLSATSKKSRSKAATGGLLRVLGEHGTLVIKDFTSILSVDRNVRNSVLSALREIHDGKWNRTVGSDGGQSISWEGRITCVAACTTAWDSAHSVVASMGPRFVTIRSSARVGRTDAGKRAMRNTGAESAMRQEITRAVAALIASAKLDPRDAMLTEEDENKLVQAADIVTLARTAVETDYHGNVIDAHEPEMPTRFAKQLVLIFRGALSIGIERMQALALALRCARDSVPPLRLAVLHDLAENDVDDCRVADVAKRLQKPWTTIDRTLNALHVLQLVTCVNVDGKAEGKAVRHYSLASGVCLDALGGLKFFHRKSE
jgi:hypothetical protein